MKSHWAGGGILREHDFRAGIQILNVVEIYFLSIIGVKYELR